MSQADKASQAKARREKLEQERIAKMEQKKEEEAVATRARAVEIQQAKDQAPLIKAAEQKKREDVKQRGVETTPLIERRVEEYDNIKHIFIFLGRNNPEYIRNYIEYSKSVTRGISIYRSGQYSLKYDILLDDGTKENIHIIDLMIVIYYILNVSIEEAIDRMRVYYKLDDNRVYEFNTHTIEYILDLLKIDKELGDSEGVKSLIISLGDLQILNIIKLKCPTTKEEKDRHEQLVRDGLTELHRLPGEPLQKGDSSRRDGTASQTHTFRGSPVISYNNYKYLKYKRKYIALKNRINI